MKSKAKARQRLHLVLRLALPTILVLPLVWISTYWRRPTHIQLDFSAARLAFTVGGDEDRELLNRSVAFSSLVIEGCNTATFAADRLEVADPQQLVPATRPQAAGRFPATSWRAISPTDPVKLSCRRDLEAKLTLRNADATATQLGVLDRIHLAPGSQVVLEVSAGRDPALRLNIDKPQHLSLPLNTGLELEAEFARLEGIAVPFAGDILTYRVQLPEAHPLFDFTSSDRGLILTWTPPRGWPAEVFREPLDLPVTSLNLVAEEPEGALSS
jgi:hypothetical protein